MLIRHRSPALVVCQHTWYIVLHFVFLFTLVRDGSCCVSTLVTLHIFHQHVIPFSIRCNRGVDIRDDRLWPSSHMTIFLGFRTTLYSRRHSISLWCNYSIKWCILKLYHHNTRVRYIQFHERLSDRPHNTAPLCGAPRSLVAFHKFLRLFFFSHGGPRYARCIFQTKQPRVVYANLHGSVVCPFPPKWKWHFHRLNGGSFTNRVIFL